MNYEIWKLIKIYLPYDLILTIWLYIWRQIIDLLRSLLASSASILYRNVNNNF